MWAAVAQLDFDESEEPWNVIYGTMPIQLENSAYNRKKKRKTCEKRQRLSMRTISELCKLSEVERLRASANSTETTGGN